MTSILIRGLGLSVFLLLLGTAGVSGQCDWGCIENEEGLGECSPGAGGGSACDTTCGYHPETGEPYCICAPEPCDPYGSAFDILEIRLRVAGGADSAQRTPGCRTARYAYPRIFASASEPGRSNGPPAFRPVPFIELTLVSDE